jgi:hypothetical protein
MPPGSRATTGSRLRRVGRMPFGCNAWVNATGSPSNRLGRVSTPLAVRARSRISSICESSSRRLANSAAAPGAVAGVRSGSMTLASARRTCRWTGISLAVVFGMLLTACSDSSSPNSGTSAVGPRAESGNPDPRGGPVVAVPASIDSTGRTDVTKQLQHLITTTPDGRVIRFRSGGSYLLNGTLSVNGRHNLTFDGAGALVFATAKGGTNRSQFWVRDGSGITFRNLRIRGANSGGGTSDDAYVAKLAKQHGIRLEGVNGAEVDHVTVTNVYGDFVYVGLDAREVASRNVWIHDSTFRANGRQGVAVTAATGVVIEHNSFDDTRRSTIDLEPTGHRWRVDHVFVLDNAVGKGRLLFVASHGLGPVDNVVISGNQLRGHSLTIDVLPPGKRRRSNWIVTDNSSDLTVKSRPLRFAAIDGLELRGNVQKVAGGQPAVALSGVCGQQVSGNEFGAGAIRETGKTCAAALAVPAQPAIPGRAPSSGRPAPTDTSNDTGALSIWIWIAVAVGALLVLGVPVLVLRRRSRSRSDDNDLVEPES